MRIAPPLDSCGKAIDILRSCYRTKMRFGDSDDQVLDVEWYFVKDPTQLLGRPTAFGSTIWGKPEASSLGPGEVRGAPRPWRPGTPPSWDPTINICGSVDDWANGFGLGVLPQLPLDPVTFQPLCCQSEEVVTDCCPDGIANPLYLKAQRVSFPLPPPLFCTLTWDPLNSWFGGFLNVSLTEEPHFLEFRLSCIPFAGSRLWFLDYLGCQPDDVFADFFDTCSGVIILDAIINVGPSCLGLAFSAEFNVTIQDTPFTG